MENNSLVKIFLDGVHLIDVESNHIKKFGIGHINYYLSEKYFNYNNILLKDEYGNLITDDILNKMIKNRKCVFNVYLEHNNKCRFI